MNFIYPLLPSLYISSLDDSYTKRSMTCQDMNDEHAFIKLEMLFFMVGDPVKNNSKPVLFLQVVCNNSRYGQLGENQTIRLNTVSKMIIIHFAILLVSHHQKLEVK